MSAGGPRPLRGWFAAGAEGISKPMNLGAILRTAHAFGASFAFTVDAHHAVRDVEQADTSRSTRNLPYYAWGSIAEMALPNGCALVGVELTDEAVDLPSFRHPLNAAYVFGRERGSLTDEMQALCAHVVKIPTKFCVNVSVAAALTFYDRTLCLGGYPARPLMPGGPELGPATSWPRPARSPGQAEPKVP